MGVSLRFDFLLLYTLKQYIHEAEEYGVRLTRDHLASENPSNRSAPVRVCARPAQTSN